MDRTRRDGFFRIQPIDSEEFHWMFHARLTAVEMVGRTILLAAPTDPFRVFGI